MLSDKLKPDTSELEDYAASYGQDSRDLVRYAANKLTPDLAIAVTKLFWPDFVLHQNCVLLAFRFDEKNFNTWEQQLDGDLAAVERMINHVHLAADLLVYPFENLSYPNIDYFGKILVQIWEAALKTRFPDRSFRVIGEKDGDLDDFVVTFWQVSKKS